VHKEIAASFLPKMKQEFDAANVKIRGDEYTRDIIDVDEAKEDDYHTEYLDKIISIKIVDDLDEAIEFINKYSSGHTESIMTENKETAYIFLKKVDSGAVFWNASTRFTDGGCFGMGCEMGISTDKLHARGPMGLKEMTSYKYIIEGNGNIRE